MATISLCMIVKNEEKNLDRCLSCLADLMDEIIVVDTGSTDRTKEIARKYTDRIYDFEWTDDFAAARNFAFSKASMEYIYSADADEVLDEENRGRFRLLKRELLPEIEIVQMYYCNQLERGDVYNFDREYRPRLFKRVRGFTWVDPIHETVRTKPVVFDSGIEIIHRQEESHAARDLAAFARICEREGTLSSRLQGMYARELYIAGKKEDFVRAAHYFERCAEETARTEEEVKEALCVAARGARLSGDKEKFFRFALKAAALGGCAESCLELGYYYRDEKDYEEACVWFYNAAFETESLLDIRSGGGKPLLELARCRRLLGREAEAAEYERLAVERTAGERNR